MDEWILIRPDLGDGSPEVMSDHQHFVSLHVTKRNETKRKTLPSSVRELIRGIGEQTYLDRTQTRRNSRCARNASARAASNAGQVDPMS